MNAPAQHHPFPTAKALAALTFAGLLVAAVILWAVSQLRPGDTQAINASAIMCVVGILAAWVGVSPVIVAGPWGVMPTIFAYFIGTALRVALCLAAAMMAVGVFKMDDMIVGVTLVALYLPLLFIEAGIVARYLWMKDFLNRNSGTAGAPATRDAGFNPTHNTKVLA